MKSIDPKLLSRAREISAIEEKAAREAARRLAALGGTNPKMMKTKRRRSG
jgi:hypothetical protein